MPWCQNDPFLRRREGGDGDVEGRGRGGDNVRKADSNVCGGREGGREEELSREITRKARKDDNIT